VISKYLDSGDLSRGFPDEPLLPPEIQRDERMIVDIAVETAPPSAYNVSKRQDERRK
jgi:hypothetical protein